MSVFQSLSQGSTLAISGLLTSASSSSLCSFLTVSIRHRTKRRNYQHYAVFSHLDSILLPDTFQGSRFFCFSFSSLHSLVSSGRGMAVEQLCPFQLQQL
jgi:hypothetical protein